MPARKNLGTVLWFLNRRDTGVRNFLLSRNRFRPTLSRIFIWGSQQSDATNSRTQKTNSSVRELLRPLILRSFNLFWKPMATVI